MSIIIGIDHGYYAIKTAHCSFPAGLTSYGEHEPYTRQGLLEFGGCFFVCGSGRQPIQRDKTINDKPGAPMHTLTTKDRHGVLYEGRIRRLTPRECLRLQGWADDRIDTVLAIQSDNQAYKQADNGVTVHVVEAIGRRIAKMDAELRGETPAP